VSKDEGDPLSLKRKKEKSTGCVFAGKKEKLPLMDGKML